MNESEDIDIGIWLAETPGLVVVHLAGVGDLELTPLAAREMANALRETSDIAELEAMSLL